MKHAITQRDTVRRKGFPKQTPTMRGKESTNAPCGDVTLHHPWMLPIEQSTTPNHICGQTTALGDNEVHTREGTFCSFSFSLWSLSVSRCCCSRHSRWITSCTTTFVPLTQKCNRNNTQCTTTTGATTHMVSTRHHILGLGGISLL